MSLEMLENKQPLYYIKRTPSGTTYLSCCFICNTELQYQPTYRHLCNPCSTSMSFNHRIKLWKAAQDKYPELI